MTGIEKLSEEAKIRLTIIIPTKNRVQVLRELLESIRCLDSVGRVRPEVIVVDNNSADNTDDVAASIAKNFPTTLRVLKVPRPGKSAAVNEAVNLATGDVLAFLDDDVVVDKTWLTAIDDFFRESKCQAGQGVIRLQSPAGNDPEILKLVERYRTIPRLEHKKKFETLHSLNGANFFLRRSVFERVGGFDERLGPGAAGTSEDVELAHRLTDAKIAIGYAPRAIVYHRVDSDRLTDDYFKQLHRRQGASRFLIRRQGTVEILFNLAHVAFQYMIYAVFGNERKRYRSKGRIYHYLGMMAAKNNSGDLKHRH